MKPLVTKAYEPPQCGLMFIGTDVQANLGQRVRCSNPAIVQVQIEESGNTAEICKDHLYLFDGRIDWTVKP